MKIGFHNIIKFMQYTLEKKKRKVFVTCVAIFAVMMTHFARSLNPMMNS